MGNQERDLALIILPTISGSISFLCSLMLCIRLIRHRRTLLKKVKERLLLGMSLLDILFSLACIMSTFAGPSYLLEGDLYALFSRYKPMGTRETCNFQGWLYQLGSSTPLYNASLCFYYYLAICQKMSDSRIQVWIEPLMHSVIWSWGLVTASVAVGLNLIWYSGYNGCFIFDPTHWVRCDVRPDLPDCQQSFSREVIVRVLTLPTNVFSILSIVVFVSLIFREVKRTEQNAKKWSFSNNRAFQKQISRTKEKDIDNRVDFSLGHTGTFAISTFHSEDTNSRQTRQEPSEQQNQYKFNMLDRSKVVEDAHAPSSLTFASTSQHREATKTSLRLSLTNHDVECPSRQPVDYNNEDYCFRNDSSVEPATSVVSSLMHEDTSRKKKKKKKHRGAPMANAITETGVQYVFGYLITYVPIMIHLFFTGTEKKTVDSFVVAITLPLQGFWNWLIYTRGRLKVLRARRRGPLETKVGWREKLYFIFFE